MLKLNFNGLNESFTLFNFISISFNREKISPTPNKEMISSKEDIKTPTSNKSQFKDSKTLLRGWEVRIIQKINNDLSAYLFIEKETTSSYWYLVAPIIHEKETNRIFQFGLGYFALEGCGGGLGNTRSLLYQLAELKKKRIKVNIIPRVVDSLLLRNFEFVDSQITLNNLIENSIDLINYREGRFEWIYKNYVDISTEYDI